MTPTSPLARPRYQAHCIFCGRDATGGDGRLERCPRCGGRLFSEIDLLPMAFLPGAPRVERRGRGRGRLQRERTQTAAV